MLVLFGNVLKNNQNLNVGLTQLHGIGKITATNIMNTLGFSPNLKIKELTKHQEFLITQKVKENYRVEDNLKDYIKGNILIKINNGSIIGFRHRQGLPVRGQRTHTNAQTAHKLHFRN
jgi:small subunit ribosomal protein S13